MNTGDVMIELHEMVNENVSSDCEKQLFTFDYAEERSVELRTTRIVFL